MSPAFCHDDYVVSCAWGKTRYRIGDVVIASHPKLGTLIKRIVRVDDRNRVLLTGDNPVSSDSLTLGWQPSSRLIGKVRWHIAGPKARGVCQGHQLPDRAVEAPAHRG